MTKLLPATLRPMEARPVSELPADGLWQFEPKWDGFRCLAFRSGAKVKLRAKSGRSLTRYFPEIVVALKALSITKFVLDGVKFLKNIVDAMDQLLTIAESDLEERVTDI